MKFIPKELTVHYRHFNSELPVPVNYKHLTEEQLISYQASAQEETLLSFFVSMHDEGTKAYVSRTKTAKDWANYGRLFIEGLEKVVSNAPTKGYKFVNTTRRYRTNNVLFQIEHPEGFVFEISSENAYEILENCTVQNCEIKDELFFNTNRYLLNSNFGTYKEQVLREQAVSGSTGIKVGDVVLMTVICGELQYNRDPHKLMYLGKTHLYTLGDNTSTKEHIFRHIETSKILVCKDSFVKSNYKETLEGDYELEFIEDLGKYVQEQIHKFNLIDIGYKNYKRTTYIICADNKPIKRHQITQSYEPIVDVSDEHVDNIQVLFDTTHGYLALRDAYFLNPNNYHRRTYIDVSLYPVNSVQNVTSDGSSNSEYHLIHQPRVFSLDKFKELREKNTIQVKYTVKR